MNRTHRSNLGEALLLLPLFALTLLTASGCGFDTRAASFECTTNQDCDEFRRCVEGICEVRGTECHPDCDDCDRGICIMNCGGASDCAREVVCPPSRVCRVNCTGAASCSGGVDCSDATTCVVDCRAGDSCAGPIDCGISDCTVNCLGRDSCASTVDCSDACACETTCDPESGRTCEPLCPGGTDCSAGANCTSDRAGCNVCE